MKEFIAIALAVILIGFIVWYFALRRISKKSTDKDYMQKFADDVAKNYPQKLSEWGKLTARNFYHDLAEGIGLHVFFYYDSIGVKNIHNGTRTFARLHTLINSVGNISFSSAKFSFEKHYPNFKDNKNALNLFIRLSLIQRYFKVNDFSCQDRKAMFISALSHHSFFVKHQHEKMGVYTYVDLEFKYNFDTNQFHLVDK